MSSAGHSLLNEVNMDAEKIEIDGRMYDVYISYPSRIMEFELVEGANSGVALDFSEIRDIGGTKYKYTMSVMPNPQSPDDFDKLIDCISAPVACHTVKMPYGQSWIEFNAIIRSGSVIDYGVKGAQRIWGDLQISFDAQKPQRLPRGTI